MTHKRFVLGVMGSDESGQGLLGAEDGAAEFGLGEGCVLEADAEDGVRAWDAVADDFVTDIRGIEEEGERGDLAVERGGRR